MNEETTTTESTASSVTAEKIQEYLEVGMDLVIQYAGQIVLGLIIFIIGRWIAKSISSIAKKGFKKSDMDETLIGFLGTIIYSLLMVMVVIVALGVVGIQTTSFVAVLGAAGLAVGLALQGSLSNFASGVMIIIFKPFKVGDFVSAGGEAGIVEGISLFTTNMRTPDNKEVIVPNSAITSGSITNFTARDTRRMDLVFGVGYGDDIKKVKEVIWEVLNADDRILKDPAPGVGVLELADSSVNFAVRPWVKTSEYWDVFFDLNETMKQRFDAEGISIPFPQRDVHLMKEES